MPITKIYMVEDNCSQDSFWTSKKDAEKRIEILKANLGDDYKLDIKTIDVNRFNELLYKIGD